MNKKRAKNNLPQTLLAAMLQAATFASPTAAFANAKTSAPGAGLSSSGATGSTSGNKDLSVGSYVELDESIRNDMYGTIEFPRAQLKDIVLAISKLASKNFILDRKLENREVTIISPEPVTKQEAYYAFLSALNMNGLTVVSVGKFLKIIEIKSANQTNTRVFVGDYAPPSEEIVTVLYTLKHLNAEDIERFVTEMVPRTSRVTAYPDTNTLVMTDTGINLRRVMAVLKSIDSPGYQEQLENIPIRYGSAKSIAALIQEILDAQNPGARRTTRPGSRNVQKTRGGGIISKIVPDERTNSLVVLANGRGVKELKDLIVKLDTPGASGSGNIHIYYCKNAVAEELAATITSLLSGTKSGSSNSNLNNPAPGGNAATRPLLGGNTAGNSSSRGSGDVSLSGDLKVTADKATNSLVVVASGADYASLKSILRKLDIPRRQVFVEATIMEMVNTDGKEFSFSVNYAGENVPSAIKIDPSNSFTIQNLANPTALNGLISAIGTGKIVGGTINGTQWALPTVSSLIRAINESALGQIMHQPTILTSDNQEAEIKVTDTIPVKKSTTTLSDSGSTSQVTYDKEPIEVSLKITPQIGEDNDLVKLKVEQTIDDFVNAPDSQIRKTKRYANTNVGVRSGDTIAIGGLQKTSTSSTRSRYPLLGDLPILGWLFKSTVDSETKTNLVLFLTPHVIDSYEDLVKITESAIDKRLELSKKMRDPRDSHIDDIKKLKEKNKVDAQKAPPKSWSFKPANAQSVDPDVEPYREEPAEEGQDSAFIYIEKQKPEKTFVAPPISTPGALNRSALADPNLGIESLDEPPPPPNPLSPSNQDAADEGGVL